MKNLLITAISSVVLIGATLNSFGQNNVVVFQNNKSYSPAVFGNGPNAGQKVTGTAGQYTYGLYVGGLGSTDISQMTLVDTVGNFSVVFAAGAISGGAVTLPAEFVAGTQYPDLVVGWTTADGSYSGSLNAGDYTGISQLGFVTPNEPPGQVFGPGPGQITGLTLTIMPEPSTIALGSLGAAALLLFRRKKQ